MTDPNTVLVQGHAGSIHLCHKRIRYRHSGAEASWSGNVLEDLAFEACEPRADGSTGAFGV